MTVEKARQFVYSGSDTFLSIGSLLYMLWCYVPLAFVATVFGVVVGGGSLVLCIGIDFLVVLYAVAAFILRAKWNAYVFSVRFWVNGCSSMFTSVFFLLLAIQILISGDGFRGSPYIPLYIGLLVVGYFVFVSGLFLFIVYRIRNGKHDASPSKSTQSSVAYFIVGGVSVGVGLVRVFIHSVSQE
ncbi:MAG: hypothetical protein LBJ43_00350, partial [Propionibacteriaceae bacterium]|nr:hypothetical protein [Propionibacteriaceae bacterium]